jgi:hypothetical protein
MNIAVGALVLLLLIFPGILFRYAYLSGPYSRRNFQSSVSDEVVLSLIPAFLIQTAAYCIIEFILHIDINISLLVRLVSQISLVNPGEFEIVENSIVLFSIFNILTCTFGFFAGKLFRMLVFKNNWDIKYHSLRFNNEWYYLLSGRILDFPTNAGDSRRIDLVRVDVMSESQGKTIIYSGILREFYLSKADGLDRIYLTNVYRRNINDDMPREITAPIEQEFDDRYYKMPGDLFVIPYQQIRNINITYYIIEEEGL